MKTPETEDLEQRLLYKYFKMGSHIAFEVNLYGAMTRTLIKDQTSHEPKNIQLDDPGIADAVQVDNYGVITCFELKVTKSDFHGDAKLSFIGNKNYYVMPEKLYEQVKNEIPPNIGVLVPLGNKDLRFAKKCKSQEMAFDKEAILIAIVTASHNHTTLSSLMEFAPYRFKKAERPKKPNTPMFDKKKHRFARLEDGTIEPLYHPNGKPRNFYKDEFGEWRMDFDRYVETEGMKAQMYMDELITEFLEENK